MVKSKSKQKKAIKVISVRSAAKKKGDKTKAKKANGMGTFMQLVSKIDYRLGKYAFAVGVLAALIFAFTNGDFLPKELGIFLIIIGIIIGLINITHREKSLFLLATIALIVTNGANIRAITLWNVGAFLQSFIMNLTILFAPAAVIIAIECIYSLAKKR